MHSPLSFLPLAALTHAASISCGTPLTTGSLWYTSPTNTSGTLGILEAYGNAELLATYPNTNVAALTLSVVPCNSTVLAAYPEPANSDSGNPIVPVKLQLTGSDAGDCLALESTDAANVFITKQACVDEDGDAQTGQFWTRDRNDSLTPTWQAGGAYWNLQFNEDDTEEVFANPEPCYDGQTCQDGDHLKFVVGKGSPDRR